MHQRRPDYEDSQVLIIGSDLIVTKSVSPISFQTEGGDYWKVWDRYITLDGKRAFHIGNICGTCAFLFERLSGANRSINIDAAVSKLNEGIGELDAELVNVLKELCCPMAAIALCSCMCNRSW